MIDQIVVNFLFKNKFKTKENHRILLLMMKLLNLFYLSNNRIFLILRMFNNEVSNVFSISPQVSYKIITKKNNFQQQQSITNK